MEGGRIRKSGRAAFKLVLLHHPSPPLMQNLMFSRLACVSTPCSVLHRLLARTFPLVTRSGANTIYSLDTLRHRCWVASRCRIQISACPCTLPVLLSADQTIIQTPSRGVDTLTDGVTLRPSHVPPQNAGILALWHTACFHDTG